MTNRVAKIARPITAGRFSQATHSQPPRALRRSSLISSSESMPRSESARTNAPRSYGDRTSPRSSKIRSSLGGFEAIVLSPLARQRLLHILHALRNRLRQVLRPERGDEHIILDPNPQILLREVHPRLHRHHHPRLERPIRRHVVHLHP